MKTEKLSDAIGKIDADLIHEADQVRRPKNRRPLWVGLVAAALCVCVAIGAIYPILRNSAKEDSPSSQAGTPSAFRLAAPTYPTMHPRPSAELMDSDYAAYNAEYDLWREDYAAQRSYGDSLDADAFSAFVQNSAQELLLDTDGENRVYSPSNIYMVLALLAETTDHNSRAQILSLLGMEDIEALRTQATALWNAAFSDDGITTSILANSIWLRDGDTYNTETLQRLAEIYYASSFSGEMGSEAYNQALRNWLNEQTGDLLKEQAQKLEMAPETVFALASTIYFKSAWETEFDPNATQTDTFHTLNGDVDAEFMHGQENVYYRGEHYGAVQCYMENGTSMWLILPDEDSSIDEVLTDGEALRMTTAQDWQSRDFLQVNLALPKFDICSDLDLIDSLKNLGVTDVFDEKKSDFTPLTAREELSVSKASHAARVLIDEEGCEAAAYTVITVTGSGAKEPPEEMDFVLDRPFLFVITGSCDQPLFVGTVYQP